MSLRSVAAEEFRANLVADGDAVVLTDSESVSYELIGRVVRTDEKVDPGTKVRFHEPQTRISLALADLPDSFSEDMAVSVRDVDGDTVTGVVRSPEYDRTLGFVVFIIEVSDG